ncbi:MAG TPA: bifunctional glutamate N-acetyltransferase/amino-acid acetyltransferase ArgJ [Acidimicrobiia bacterium]|nr:bifunctional glutamate N-acetyltransferase/amino-acid acetyltransferase ArgJ [Acidimicrobiia bacterium]
MSVLAARGFVAGGLACGVKDAGVADLAVVAVSPARPVTAAGVFTTNLATAAPVLVTREHLHDGHAAAVVLNSGNANAATGPAGRADARRMCDLTAAGLGVDPADVLVCSTGLIGIPLPMAPLEAGIPGLVAQLGPDGASAEAAADAILTTDTVRKVAVATGSADGVEYTVGGMAKGAAMLAPAMATMLAVITTDAAIDARALRAALGLAITDSFNTLLVDGSMSTNDTVLVLANGAAMAERAPIGIGGPSFHGFVAALSQVCRSLSDQMAADAEGATKMARVHLHGARTDTDARLAARAVAGSQLVQCSLNGEDPYWGRVLSEIGASGADLDPERVDIAYNGIVVCRDGVAAAHDEAALGAAMTERELTIDCDLHLGSGEASVTFTDLSYAYIDENRGTS